MESKSINQSPSHETWSTRSYTKTSHTHQRKQNNHSYLFLKELKNSFCYINSDLNLTSKDIVAQQLTGGPGEDPVLVVKPHTYKRHHELWHKSRKSLSWPNQHTEWFKGEKHDFEWMWRMWHVTQSSVTVSVHLYRDTNSVFGSWRENTIQTLSWFHKAPNVQRLNRHLGCILVPLPPPLPPSSVEDVGLPWTSPNRPNSSQSF